MQCYSKLQRNPKLNRKHFLTIKRPINILSNARNSLFNTIIDRDHWIKCLWDVVQIKKNLDARWDEKWMMLTNRGRVKRLLLPSCCLLLDMAKSRAVVVVCECVVIMTFLVVWNEKWYTISGRSVCNIVMYDFITFSWILDFIQKAHRREWRSVISQKLQE